MDKPPYIIKKTRSSLEWPNSPLSSKPVHLQSSCLPSEIHIVPSCQDSVLPCLDTCKLHLFFFSPLVVWDELASPGKMLWWCDHESTAAIHLGIGHITGWSVGDRVRQMVPTSQPANVDVVICQDDVISKNIVVFRFLRVNYP